MGSQQGNLHQSLAMTRRVTCFIPRACIWETALAAPAKKNFGRGFGKYEAAWTGRKKCEREKYPEESQACMAMCIHLHLSLNREDRWGTADDFTISFLHFSLFSTALFLAVVFPPLFLSALSSYRFHRAL